ncbi:hypothetical protein L227DRAFT_323117 [Lentinus tigrinus ALCF2SS1-6]|uniref:Velvet domain-containing protein n=1 Tax=Lentinus tigrinus ALCF2SS1-6 TaxID=1328759 RepID=A0A5C2SLT4_9APHY|nr:hypothetical protein L227DRAFT_323117 [Lentinus tigrinus ALCF2SS1-6]
MLADSLHLDQCASSGVLASGHVNSHVHTVSPKDRSKLSINFLSGSSPRAAADPYPRHHHSSPLSSRARGVNRPDTSRNNADDVEVAAADASDDHTRTYRLDIVQHPDRTAEFGASTLTRLPLAPPLIAQLVMRDSAGRTIIDELELPFLVAQLSLLTSDGSAPMDYVTDGEGRSTRERLLYGNLVSSPHLLRNLQGRRGVYFMFPDVGIRQRGRFVLKVTLIKLPRCVCCRLHIERRSQCIRMDDPSALAHHGGGTIVTETRSLPFDVYPLRDYVAPAQTPLTQYFLQQGARMIPPPPRVL